MTIVLLSAVAYAPWWFSAGFILLAAWRFGGSYELLLPAAIADLAYGTSIVQFFGLAFPATFFTALTVVGGRILTNRFFFHS